MAILNLVDRNDPILRKVAEPFDFSNPPTDPAQLYNDMGETMIAKKGLGLAANQVGLPYRFFVLTGEKVLGVFNPKVVDFSPEMVIMNEGCLSYPGLVLKVKRPAHIRARFTMPDGQTTTMKFEGLSARCFLHELDHLDGIVHISRANAYHREQAYKMMKNYDRVIKRTARR